MMTQQKSRSRGVSKPIIPIHSGVVSGTIKVRDDFNYYSTYGPTEIFEKLFGDIAEVG